MIIWFSKKKKKANIQLKSINYNILKNCLRVFLNYLRWTNLYVPHFVFVRIFVFNFTSI
jgi:hypothetical protein